ncbi:hypothetical protein AS850_12635 [Frondihabitans sp. 762G35]|uniref:hypothetical protein n=1 Tax=Frondihabitans sp. 762G35 TaxID=1446794 RepID=UPI000D22B1AC|nr:hypothetical protein [Frondihabitans sp. 762G35]ARC57923.1 hypothetical protein AS850_12635 [Frondihabitans sp. 762G35]
MTDDVAPAPGVLHWSSSTEGHWEASIDTTVVGTIDRFGSFIASNAYGRVVGTFHDLADAKRAIEAPGRTFLARRREALRDARVDTVLRRVATVVGALAALAIVGAAVVMGAGGR